MKKKNHGTSANICTSLSLKLPTVAGLKALSPSPHWCLKEGSVERKPTLHYQDNLNWTPPLSMMEENKHLGCIL